MACHHAYMKQKERKGALGRVLKHGKTPAFQFPPLGGFRTPAA